MIKTVFPPNTIALDRVQLARNARPSRLSKNTYAYVPFTDMIVFPDPGAHQTTWYSEDFSKEPGFFSRTLLIHEIVHIWQIQRDIPYDLDFRKGPVVHRNGRAPEDISVELLKDIYEYGPLAGSIRIKGKEFAFFKPMAETEARRINSYITVHGPIDVDQVEEKHLARAWFQRRHYNHGAHDLAQTLFWEMNPEEQAEVIVDYFCLINNRAPEMERYMISTHKRPPIEVYRKIIPFL